MSIANIGKRLFATGVLLSASLTAGLAGADDLTGDSFTVTIFEGANELASATGTAGAPGDDCTITDFLDLQVEWIDGNTFELDFYSFSGPLTDFSVVISGLDFTASGGPARVTGVTEVQNDFGLTYSVQTTDSSITLLYGNLDAFDAASGEVVVFDVATEPVNGLTGDTFSLRVFESGQLRHDLTGVAGSSGRDIQDDIFLDVDIDWLSDDTFELGFYYPPDEPLTDLRFEISDLDFRRDGVVIPIVAIEEFFSDFGWPYTEIVQANSITLSYGMLDNAQASDGDVLRFRVLTEPRCVADTNGDGALSPADFNGWIIAFNNNAPACDQNDDGLCTPADFNAWIINFNTGCP